MKSSLGLGRLLHCSRKQMTGYKGFLANIRFEVKLTLKYLQETTNNVIYEPMTNILSLEEAFLNNLKTKAKSFNTVKNYKADFNCFKNYLLAEKKSFILNHFSLEEVKKYEVYLSQKYSSANSIRRRIQCIRLFFDYLVIQGHYPQNPFTAFTAPKKTLLIPEPCNFSEILRFYTLLKDFLNKSKSDLEQLYHARNLVIFHLIYGAGLKVSDLHHLKLNHLLKDKKKFRIMVAHPKMDPYSIPLPLICSTDLQLYLNLRQKVFLKFDHQFDDLLFNANPYRILGGGLSPRGIELLFEDLRKRYKFKLTAKNLRQACIYKWLNQKVPESLIKQWLGLNPLYSLRMYSDQFKLKPKELIYNEVVNNES